MVSTLKANGPVAEQEVFHRSGKLEVCMANALVEERLQVHQLNDIDRLFAHQENLDQRHTGRAVWNTTIEDRKHHAFQVFVKLHAGKLPLIPRLSEFRNGLYLKPYPVREWEGIGAVGELGLSVPERLALFHEKGRQFRSAVITKEVPGRQSVYNMIENHSWKSLGDDFQAGIMDQILAILHRIHEGGYGWRGVSTGHYFPVLGGDGTWALSVIDLEGIHPGASRSVVKRDFAKLMRCLQQYGGGDFAVNYAKQTWGKRARLQLNQVQPVSQSEAA